MAFVSMSITGMTCDHCARSAQDALNALPGVSASVSFARAQARIETTGETDAAMLVKAVESKGFGASLETATDEIGERKTGNQLRVAIVGTGSGAFAAAIKAAEEGAVVTLVEGADVIGGTCVNVGCVPSKIMIRGAHIAHMQVHHSFDGIAQNQPAIDRAALVRQQQTRVEEPRHAKYEQILADNPGINLIRGWARFEDAHTLSVTGADGEKKTVIADRLLIVTNARPAIPDIPGLSDTPNWTSTEALVAEQMPKHLAIIGGSVVALELAQAYLHLGAEVIILARSVQLSKEDPALGAALVRIFEEEGARVLLNTVPDEVTHDGRDFILTSQAGVIRADRLLVATGRQPNTERLGLEKIGVQTGHNGAVVIDNRMRTSADYGGGKGQRTSGRSPGIGRKRG